MISVLGILDICHVMNINEKCQKQRAPFWYNILIERNHVYIWSSINIIDTLYRIHFTSFI